MKNAIADIRFTARIPEGKVAVICSRVGLDSADDAHYDRCIDAIEEWVKDNLAEALDYADEPEVEADA